MKQTIKSHERARQVLALLGIHGPLPFRTLLKFISPTIQERRLHDTIARLKRKGLIKARFENIFSGRGIFYQLAQGEDVRNKSAKLLGCEPDKLIQSEIHYKALLHTEQCALVSNFFKKKYPSSNIVRDFNFFNSDLAKRLMLTRSVDRDVIPDLLLIFQNNPNKEPVSIAIEIEKTRKSNERLLAKIYKYVTQTQVDGVIYICEDDSLKERIMGVFRSNSLRHNLRIKHYVENFFMFSTLDSVQVGAKLKLLNIKTKSIDTEKWLTYLNTTLPNFRRDIEIYSSALTC